MVNIISKIYLMEMSTLMATDERKQCSFSICIHCMRQCALCARSTLLETKFSFNLMINFSPENRIHLTNVRHKLKY